MLSVNLVVRGRVGATRGGAAGRGSTAGDAWGPACRDTGPAAGRTGRPGPGPVPSGRPAPHTRQPPPVKTPGGGGRSVPTGNAAAAAPGGGGPVRPAVTATVVKSSCCPAPLRAPEMVKSMLVVCGQKPRLPAASPSASPTPNPVSGSRHPPPGSPLRGSGEPGRRGVGAGREQLLQPGAGRAARGARV